MAKATLARHPIDQSALYKLGSKKKLAELLDVAPRFLRELTKDNTSYYGTFRLSQTSLIDHPLFQKKEREIQSVKPELDRIHKRIFTLLRRIETPEYLHSAVKGRSYSSNALTHLESKEAIKFDIKSFYPSVSWTKVYAFFLKDLHCEPDIAYILSRICCFNGKLPTGSSLSPLLSFLANQRMFNLLNSYAIRYGLKMTLYVDDVVLSGNHIKRSIKKLFTKTFEDHGYIAHKIVTYKKSIPKTITGLIVDAGDVAIPNRRCAKVRLLLDAVKLEVNNKRREKLLKSLMGMLNELKQINPSFAQSASIQLVGSI